MAHKPPYCHFDWSGGGMEKSFCYLCDYRPVVIRFMILLTFLLTWQLRLRMSDSYVDLSTALEMTIGRVASDYSGGSYLLYLRFKAWVFVRFIFIAYKPPYCHFDWSVSEMEKSFCSLCDCLPLVINFIWLLIFVIWAIATGWGCLTFR